MFADHIGNISRRQIELGHANRVQHQPHAVVLCAEDQGIPDTGQSFKVIDDLQDGIIGEKERIVSWVFGFQREHGEKIRRLLFDGDALAYDLWR